MSDNVIRKYTYLQVPRIRFGLRPHGIIISVLRYQTWDQYHGRRKRVGATPPPSLERGEVLLPPTLNTPSRRLHLIYFDFKSRPPL